MKDVVTNITNSSTLCTRKLIICMLFCVSLRLTYVADRSLAGILWWLSYRLATTSWSPLHSTVIPKTNTHTHIDVLCYEVWRFLESRVLKLVTFTVPCIVSIFQYIFNPLNPELNPICYLLALLGAHHFLHVSRIRVKLLTFRGLMLYIYGAPILDVSRSHTTTQHSR